MLKLLREPAVNFGPVRLHRFGDYSFLPGARIQPNGVKALRRPAVNVEAPEFQAPQFGRIFRDGFLVALLNPKTAIFFAAFLPQFINPAASAAGQSVVLGAVFVLVAASTDTIYVLTANALATVIGGKRSDYAWGRYATAATFIGLGIFTAASGSRSK